MMESRIKMMRHKKNIKKGGIENKIQKRNRTKGKIMKQMIKLREKRANYLLISSKIKSSTKRGKNLVKATHTNP